MSSFIVSYKFRQPPSLADEEQLFVVSGDTPRKVLRAAKGHELKPRGAKRATHPSRQLIKISFQRVTVWVDGRWQKQSEAYKGAFKQ